MTSTGAPFCYPLPAGFTDFSQQTNYAPGWTYRTLVSIGVHDLIEVLATRLSFDADSLTAAKLAAVYHSGPELAPGKYTLKSVSPPLATSIDGARGFRQIGSYINGVSVEMYTVYRGHTWLSISCQALTHTVTLTSACASVRGQIRIVALK